MWTETHDVKQQAPACVHLLLLPPPAPPLCGWSLQQLAAEALKATAAWLTETACVLASVVSVDRLLLLQSF